MVLSRNQFFLLLFAVSIGPFVGYKLLWIATTKQTTGTVCFTGHTLEMQGNISQHLVIRFKTGRDTIIFDGNVYIQLPSGATVPVRYKESDPSDAKINIPICIWGDTFVYVLAPALVLLVLFFTPAFLSPLIPKNARIVLGRRPLVRIVTDVDRW